MEDERWDGRLSENSNEYEGLVWQLRHNCFSVRVLWVMGYRVEKGLVYCIHLFFLFVFHMLPFPMNCHCPLLKNHHTIMTFIWHVAKILPLVPFDNTFDFWHQFGPTLILISRQEWPYWCPKSLEDQPDLPCIFGGKISSVMCVLF